MPLTYSWPGPNALTTTTDARKALAGLIETDAAGNVRTGIFPSNTAPIISARADMNVDIAIFQGATVQFGGPILIANDGVAQLPSNLVSPGAGTNYYVVYAKQNESTSPGTDANNNRIFGAQLSTTSFAVARAAMPAGALELGTVEMPTSKTATNQGGVIITPSFRYTAAEGGVVWLRNATEQAAWTPADGGLAWRMDTSQLIIYMANATTPGWYQVGGKPTVDAYTGGTFSSVLYAAGSPIPQAVSQGGRVFVEGQITSASATFLSGTSYTIGSIPAGVAPAATVKFACTTNSTAVAEVTVATTGVITMTLNVGFTGPLALTLSGSWRQKGI